jgi:hypothetical protein
MQNELVVSLQEYFDAFIDQANYRYFTRGLIQYMDFISENPDLNDVISKIRFIEEQDYSLYKSLEKSVLKEEESSEKEIRRILKENKIENSPGIKRLLGKIDAYRNGLSIPPTAENLRNPAIMDDNCPLAWSGREFCYVLDNILFDIAKELDSLGEADILKKFHDKKGLRNNIYGDWVFSYTYFEAIDELNRVLRERNEKIYYYYSIVTGALHFVPDSQINLVKYDLEKYKFAAQTLHLFIKKNLIKYSRRASEDVDDQIVFEADISKDFKVWVKGKEDRKWGLKKKNDGKFFVAGENMWKLLNEIGKPFISREDKENLAKTLANNLPITLDQAKKIFFNSEGKYGISEEYVLLM